MWNETLERIKKLPKNSFKKKNENSTIRHFDQFLAQFRINTLTIFKFLIMYCNIIASISKDWPATIS